MIFYGLYVQSSEYHLGHYWLACAASGVLFNTYNMSNIYQGKIILKNKLITPDLIDLSN